jgi:flagellar basal-body rod modification protein FlgD
MPAVASATDPSALGAASAAAAAPASKSTEDRFLTLLVTQMRNQDPLNPLDNAQVTSQLAQLSTVSGIDKLNQTMGTVLSSLAALQPIQAAGLVGKTVAVEGNAIALSQGKAKGGYALEEPATQVSVTVTDAAGKTVRTMNLGARQPGLATFDWDGKDDGGRALPDGAYSFALSAVNGTKAASARSLAVATVQGVIPASDGFALNLGAAGIVPFARVAQIL